MRSLLVIALLALAFISAMTADAQTRAQRLQALKDKETAELRIEADMITMSNLVEALSKNLGQMHYLRALCYGDTDQKWRDYAGRMIDLEVQGDESRRTSLVRAFNAGYYQEQARHSQCGQAVAVDAAALAENGRHLASMLGDPYRLR